MDPSGEALYIRDEETGRFWCPTAWPARGTHQYVTRHGFGYSVFEYCEDGISTELTLYIRDEETGLFWCPAAWPARGAHQYVTRHGFGYSVFEYCENGISTELTVSVSIDSPVKFMALRIRNRSGRRRLLSATGYVEWVLGELRSRSLLHVITEMDPVSGAVFAKNPYNSEFPSRVAFLDANIINRTVTGDRYEFIGRNRSPDKPAAMEHTRLSNKVGAGLDPCACLLYTSPSPRDGLLSRMP